MSDTNPYASKPVEAEEAAVEETVVSNEVPAGTVAEVLAWVDDDKDRAKLALDAEKENLNRSSLIKGLKHILEG